MKTKKRMISDAVTISNGLIHFETAEKVEGKIIRHVRVIPLATFGMKMDIIDEEEGIYNHFFYDNGREIEVDGGTWMEAQDQLFHF